VINLRRFWRWRAGLAGVALTLCVFFVGGMVFTGRTPAPPPPDPVKIQSAWRTLISDALAAKRPADQPMALPKSAHAPIGLLFVRPMTH
jgi:hypothetical protein